MRRRHGRSATVLAMGTWLLAACGGGGDGGDSRPLAHAVVETPSADTSCTDPARAAADPNATFDLVPAGDYFGQTNAWNATGAAGYADCVTITDAGGGRADAVLDWNLPEAPETVRMYPEVIFGRKPWNPSSSPALPRRVDTLSHVAVTGTYSLQVAAPGATGNLAFDIWLTASDQVPAGGDHLPITHELMIWMQTFGGDDQPAGSVVATVSIEGTTWDLYETTATWGPQPWTYLAYLPRTPVGSTLHLDVHDFLADLKQRGLITGTEWLSSVELGNEVMSGRGRTTLSGYGVAVD